MAGQGQDSAFAPCLLPVVQRGWGREGGQGTGMLWSELRGGGGGVRGEHSRTWAQREHRWPSKPVLRLHSTLHGGAAGSTFFVDAITSPAASPGTPRHLLPFSPSSGSAAVPITCCSKGLSSGRFSSNTSSLVPSASTRHRTASSPCAARAGASSSGQAGLRSWVSRQEGNSVF